MRGNALLGLIAFTCTQPAIAQQEPGRIPAIRHFTEEEVSAISMPVTTFTETELITANYDKYFFYHRDETNFDQAYADIIECDAVASGISYYGGGSGNPGAFAQYGVMPAAIGSAIGSVIADAIVGSAERRRIRRINMRNCMGFKGYDRYGLEKELWQKFNFEEGFSREEAESRELALKQQARRASGAKPEQKVLGL